MCRSGNRARRSPSLNLSLPNNVSMGFGGAGLQGRSTSRSPPATPARTAGKGPASPPAGAPLGPNPAVSNGATPHLLPPCLPVPLASGTPRGDGCQVRRRCCRPKQVHGRGPDLDCHRPPLPPLSLPPPPRPKSPPSRPSATATSANLLCVIASSGRRWEGAEEEAGLRGREGLLRTLGFPTACWSQALRRRDAAGGMGRGPSACLAPAPPPPIGHAPSSPYSGSPLPKFLG